MHYHGTKILAISGAAVLALLCIFVFQKMVSAATNISPNVNEHWAWNDLAGWMNFYSTGSVNVLSPKLTGYASSSMGDISLDCATTRNGNICAQSNYAVYNDGLGALSGFAWNDTYGWVSFCGGKNLPDCPGSPGPNSYQIVIDPDTGVFNGFGYNYAWNDIIGWISFNCQNGNAQGGSVCGVSDYKVATSWRALAATGTVDSSVFDTNSPGGAQLNSFLWKGVLPAETRAGFQFSVSNCANGATDYPSCSAGSWAYIGPDHTGNTYYYPSSPGASLKLDYADFANFRYFRYRVALFTNRAQTLTPRVDDVVVIWSP